MTTDSSVKIHFHILDFDTYIVHIYLHIFLPILISDYSTQQLSDRSDKQQQQDYQQQFGLMNDQVMDSVQTGINGAGHPSEFSPRGGGGEAGTLSFPAASSKASSSVHSESKYSKKGVTKICQSQEKGSHFPKILKRGHIFKKF